MTKLRPPQPDPLANILNHPEGLPYHSTLSGLIGLSFPTYVELISAEKTWGEGFAPKNNMTRKKKEAKNKPPIDPDLNFTPAELL